jgi:DNA-binding response OmpR family regulator
MMKTLIVDDDLVLADVIAFTLKREGFEVILAHDGLTALERWEKEKPDIIVLDVNIPKLDGFQVCRRIREQANTPIIMLTVRGEEDDILQGFDIGADDYIVKPFSPRQLVARTKAVLRRAGQSPPAFIRKAGDLVLDSGRRELVIKNGQPVGLTQLENRLLDFMIINHGQVLTMESIIDYVWGPQGADRDMLRQLIYRLRVKIEPDPSNPIYIETVPGLGYGLLSGNR